MTRPTLLLLLLCAIAPPALGWGRDGHRIAAGLAERQLTPAARREVARLLAGEPEPTLPGVANWADEVRKSDPGDRGARWHYVNFRGGDCRYAPPRDCPDGDCVIAAIERATRTLADRSRPDAERRDALKLLVHFITDVHQPLHSSPRADKGGNDYQVSIAGRGSNLHAVWDRELVASRGLAPEAYAAVLAAQPPLPAQAPSGATPAAADWALESCRIVRDGEIYPAGHRIGREYLDAHRGQAELRLRVAGDRIAATLNAALAPG